MTADAFPTERRQKFLTGQYFELNLGDLARSAENYALGIRNLLARNDLKPAGQAGLFRTELDLLKLHYTACSKTTSR